MKNNSLYDIEYFKKIKNAQLARKKRLQQRRIVVLVIVAVIIIYLISPLSKIANISIVGSSRYSDLEIKKKAHVELNQFTFIKPAFLIKKQLEDTNLFSSVTVSKSVFGAVSIKVTENKLLFYQVVNKKVSFYDEKNNQLTFNEQLTATNQGVVAQLTSRINDKIKLKLVEKLSKLDQSVLSEVSQIVYKPKSYDTEYFRFIMVGQKKIYINASLDHIVKVGANYHHFARNTNYTCSNIEYIDTENKAIVKKCK